MKKHKKVEKRTYPPKVCAYASCGETFVPVREWQDYCGSSCRKKAWGASFRPAIKEIDRTLDIHEARLSALESSLRVLTDASIARRITDLNRRVKQSGEYNGPERRRP